jgi:hypothetical protein
MTQIYESPFVPAHEISTDEGFTLEMLSSDEEYTIMPATYGEEKAGAFVISVISEYEFSLRREKG